MDVYLYLSIVTCNQHPVRVCFGGIFLIGFSRLRLSGNYEGLNPARIQNYHTDS